MKIADFRGKRITVMGIGLHGGSISAIEFLAKAGAKIIATDLKLKIELEVSLEKLKHLRNVEYVMGEHRERDFFETDMVIKNPAVPWTNKYIQIALKNNISVESDSSLFFKLCKNKIIGITGTRGKTTTASLVYEILREAGKKPVQVGIAQVSVLDKLKELKHDSIVVFELSSWRLSALGRYGLSPQIAVMTNFFQDHLNYYFSMEEYLADKKYIYQNQGKRDFCVMNWDDKTLKKLEQEVPSQLIRYSSCKLDYSHCVYISNDAIYAKKEKVPVKIMDIAEIKIKGVHNLKNILAGIGVAQALNIDAKTIKKGILAFTGLPHRLEFVREFLGVKYYNDTAATSPDGTISSLKSFSEPIVLIAGGSDKNLDMQKLAEAVRNATDRVVFLKGAGTDKLINELRSAGEKNNCIIAVSMNEAVELARNLAKKGEVVLLSPGTASFGLFLNEFDRGDQFRSAVNKLN